MFTSLFGLNFPPQEPEHKEGDLYKIITAHGVTFELRYGYDVMKTKSSFRTLPLLPNIREALLEEKAK